MTPTLRATEDVAVAGRQHGAGPDSVEVIWLHETAYRTVDLARVSAAFSDEAPTWLGQPAGPGPAGSVAYACDLELRVSPEGRGLFRKSAMVTLGQPRQLGERWLILIEWRAASLAPLFPVFVGSLILAPDRLTIEGNYAPPFGVVGFVLDRAVLSIAARATARWFLAKVAAAVA